MNLRSHFAPPKSARIPINYIQIEFLLCYIRLSSFRICNVTCTFELLLEGLSYDLEMKTRDQDRNNKRTQIERFDWFVERIQTRVAFGWLSERSDE